MNRVLIITLLLFLMTSVAVSAQTQTQTLQEPPEAYNAPSQSTRDPPIGFPYNTGGTADTPILSAQVPLRDFLSSRQDLQHAELSKRIDELQNRMQQLMDERDRQYAQRFAAQQQAMDAAFVAAQEAVDAALDSAEKATSKAEAAANDRFDSVNEFRATLADQALNFVNKSTAEAQFASLNEKVDDLFIRLNTIQAQREGGVEAWGWIFGFTGFAIAVMMFIYTVSKSREVVVRRSSDVEA